MREGGEPIGSRATVRELSARVWTSGPLSSTGWTMPLTHGARWYPYSTRRRETSWKPGQPLTTRPVDPPSAHRSLTRWRSV